MTETPRETAADPQQIIAELQLKLTERIAERDEATSQQAATNEVLQVINASSGDLAPVFDAILERAMRLCEAEFGLLATYDGGQIRTVATRGVPAAFAEFRKNNPPDYGAGTGPARILAGERVVHIADLKSGDTYRAGDPNRRAVVDLGGARTVLLVPLLKNESVLGYITIYRKEVRPYSDKQIVLLQNFADQALIAIENARLFNEVQTKTRDLEKSLQQQTATADVLKIISRSVFDLQAVLDTLVESAYKLCGSNLSLLYLRGDHGFECKAIAGLGVEEASQYFKGRPICAGRATSAERVIMTGEVQSITDFFSDPEFDPKAKEVIRQAASSGSGLGVLRATLAVPMTRDKAVIGVLVIASSQTGPFPSRQIELLQTFADQAVIAIENVRLFDEVQARTRELARSLDNLQAAQERLVQTEKLASLGQLTAGIAHEIKNPLNFVNNFSALCAELVDELDATLVPAPLDHKLRGDIDELTEMLKSNLEKVVHHGKRADSIVKNMLQHSREGSGELRSADINTLVGESLDLAYHGARAEKPGFAITLKQDLDPDAGALELYPQEITRALLNLITNGFYAAVGRKAEMGENAFEPVLTAATRNLGGTVEIRIRDNGAGIPPEVREKMFNPFFTTKPTGEGTGLGLSMTHDIIVKQHGGRIDVRTEPGAFTELIITLPRDRGTAGGLNSE